MLACFGRNSRLPWGGIGAPLLLACRALADCLPYLHIARAKRSAGGDFERWVRGSFIGEAREGQACYSCFWARADRYHFNYNEQLREV